MTRTEGRRRVNPVREDNGKSNALRISYPPRGLLSGPHQIAEAEVVQERAQRGSARVGGVGESANGTKGRMMLSEWLRVGEVYKISGRVRRSSANIPRLP